MLQNNFFDLNMVKTSVVFICYIKYLSLFLSYYIKMDMAPTYITVCACASSCSVIKKDYALLFLYW